MSASRNPAGTALSPQQAEQIIASGGNFELSRVEMNMGGFQTQEIVFDPPYRLAKDEDYAFFVPSDGKPQLWQVEQAEGDRWHWLREARRVGVISDDEATRH
ncbi:hypothetical protein FG93_05464 [Bosea sp. LC85]|uniref:hypothetical protein n=1 Tax=Bosea sp. LC85 TaxID=1502851 RepID=UPI0004E34975|nr:hypothetical protein [Bosea sp. LC85]KFC63954.1 hypothetical protein FG93_05464 [Bosea sp. LC85]